MTFWLVRSTSGIELATSMSAQPGGKYEAEHVSLGHLLAPKPDFHQIFFMVHIHRQILHFYMHPIGPVQMHHPLSSLTPSLPQRLPRKTRQHKARPVDLLVVVLAQLLLLLRAPAPEWLLDIALSVLAADHKANLAGGVRGDRSVCVLDGGEDLKARFAEIGDEAEVKPLVLGYH